MSADNQVSRSLAAILADEMPNTRSNARSSADMGMSSSVNSC